MIWMKWDDRDDEGFTYTLPDFSWVGGNSLLSSPGTRNIEGNKIRRRRLGRGFAAWADANDGYCSNIGLPGQLSQRRFNPQSKHCGVC